MSRALTLEISQHLEIAIRLRLKAQTMTISLKKPETIILASAIISIGARKIKGTFANANITKKRG